MSANKALFWGRWAISNEIGQGALADQPAIFSLVGPRLSGKSALLQWLAGVGGPWTTPSTDWAAPPIALVDCAWATPDDLFEQLWAALPLQNTAVELAHPITSGEDSYQRLWRYAQQGQATNRRLVLLLDNFDLFWRAQAIPAYFHSPLHRLATTTTLVLTSAQPLADLAEETGSALTLGAVTQRFLGLLECSAAQQWLAHYQQHYQGMENLNDELLAITGRHPYLLCKLGDSLAEVRQMLAPEQPFASHHAPLIRLRLAEHARPLFIALWQQISAQPAMSVLLDRLTRTPLQAEQALREPAPALNWLINQAVISYHEDKDTAVYQLFSPLFADYLRQRRLTLAPNPSPASAMPNIQATSEDFYDQLSKMEIALLRYFEKHSQRLVTMEQLLAEVWKRPASSTRRVQEAIRRLRLQLEQQTPPIGTIENERGRGYRFIPGRG